MFMYCTVCYFTGIFYAVVRQISMLMIDNKDSVLCVYLCVRVCVGGGGGGRTRTNTHPR